MKSRDFFFTPSDKIGPRSGQVSSAQDRSDQVRSGQVSSGQIRSGQVRSGRLVTVHVSKYLHTAQSQTPRGRVTPGRTDGAGRRWCTPR